MLFVLVINSLKVITINIISKPTKNIIVKHILIYYGIA